MIFFKSHWKKGAATIEYMALIAFILGALIVFDKYIVRSFWGKWQEAGDVFGHGKQHDPRPFGVDGAGGGTLKCTFIYEAGPGQIDCDPSGICINESAYNDCRSSGNSEFYCENSASQPATGGTWVTQPCYDDCILDGDDQATCVDNCDNLTARCQDS